MILVKAVKGIVSNVTADPNKETIMLKWYGMYLLMRLNSIEKKYIKKIQELEKKYQLKLKRPVQR